MRVSQWLLSAVVVGLLVTSSFAADWPAFRGPTGNGVSPETDVPVEWNAEENIAWKASLPAPGNSSPIVSAGRVFVSCATNDGRQRHLFCFNRADGGEVWQKSVSFEGEEPTHKANPYCASTPVADGERVVVWHGSAGLYCYNFDGEELWAKDLGLFRHIWGNASSPILHKGRVILNCGPGERTFMTAIDLETGETLWKTPEPGGDSGEKKPDGSKRWVGSWCTPIITEVDGEDQILCSMPSRVVAYDPEDGEILWFCEGLANMPRGNLVYTSPLIADGIGVAMAGFRGPAIGFTLGGSGNVTEENRLWKIEKRTPQRIGSGIIVDGLIYMANAGPSVAQCIDLQTGEEQWRERLPGGNCWGSLVRADGRLYVTNQQGTTHVFRPNPEKLELVASNPLEEPSNSTPAISEGQIFIRTYENLYCIGK